MGSHSGRDGDKPSACGLTPKAISAAAANGETLSGVAVPGMAPAGSAAPYADALSVTYEEAELTFLCRKVCGQPLDKDGLAQDIRDYYAGAPKSFPPDGDGEWQPHWMFIGEIVAVEDKRA